MKRKELETLVNKKISVRELGEILNLSPTGVRYWLKKYGLKTKHRRATWKHEEMLLAIKTSETISDVLRKLNLSVRPGNYPTVNGFIKEHNVDISHIKGRSINRGGFVEKPLKDILIENSTYRNRYYLKKRLIKNSLLKNECSICGQPPEWKGKPLVMVLDHINGVNDDNRIENLRLVCRHCDSQLSTFCGRNSKKADKRYCVDCKKEVAKKSERCNKCSAKNESVKKRKVKNRPTPSEILKMRKTMTMVAIGKKYGVSDNAVRKWLK